MPELKGDPTAPPLRGSLRCSSGQAAAELALRAQTVLAEIPLTSLRYSATHRGWKSEDQNHMVGSKLPTMVKAMRLRYI